MRIDILTLFPQMFESPFSAGILGRAIASERVSINLHNIRDYTHDRHRTVDDYPYGGGAGMALKAGRQHQGYGAKGWRKIVFTEPAGQGNMSRGQHQPGLNNAGYLFGLFNRGVLAELQNYALQDLIAEGNPDRLPDVKA